MKSRSQSRVEERLQQRLMVNIAGSARDNARSSIALMIHFQCCWERVCCGNVLKQTLQFPYNNSTPDQHNAILRQG